MNTGYQNQKDLEKKNFLYYGLLAYTIIFYSQIAGRFPVLSAIRPEFLLGLVLLTIVIIKMARGDIPFTENRLNIVALVFFLITVIGIPFALVKSRSYETFIRLMKFAAIYFMIVATIDSEKKLKGFIYIYLSMIALLFVEPFFLSLQGKGFVYNNHMLRLAGVTGYFAHPNQLGSITSANIPFFYYLMFYEKSKIMKVVHFVLLVISIRVVMLTQSRTAFLGVISFGIIVWIYSKNKMASLFLAFIACIIVWQFMPQETQDRFLTLFQVKTAITVDRSDFTEDEALAIGSMQSRWELIRRSFLCFMEYPILGVGLGNFPAYNWYRWGYWFPPHNTYLQALAEIGLIGFIVFMMVIVTTLKNLNLSKRLFSSIDDKDKFLTYVTQALTVYLLVRLVVTTFGQDLYSNFWWLAGGLSVVIYRITKLKFERIKAVE